MSVILPALNEEKTVRKIVQAVKKSRIVDEILVVDACSEDRTAEVAERAGARVVRQDSSLPSGKGTTMQVGIENATGDVLVFFDADIKNFKTEFVERLTAPILRDEADFVKGSFTRKSGRVTEIIAKPLMGLFFPEVEIGQPLSGQIAGKREFFEGVKLERGWGVDAGILLDMSKTGARVKEVDLGYVEHRMKPTAELGAMSKEVTDSVMTRSVSQGRLFFGGPGNVLRRAAGWFKAREPHKRRRVKVIIFDMDGVLLKGRVIDALAGEYGFSKELRKMREKCERGEVSNAELSKSIASFLRGVEGREVERIAAGMPLNRGVKEAVRKLKQRGFKVAILSDSYTIACRVTAKRINADYWIGNALEVREGRLTGRILEGQHKCPECDFYLCKKTGVARIAKKFGVTPRECIIVGDGKNDAHAMDVTGFGVAFNASEEVKEKAHVVINYMGNLLEYLD